jgi:hypothetical protein
MSWVAGSSCPWLCRGAANALHHYPDGLVGRGRRLVAVLAVDMTTAAMRRPIVLAFSPPWASV